MKYLIIIFLVLTSVFSAQTVWIDSGSVYMGLETKEITFSGVISDGDTLVSLPFDLAGYENIYSGWYELSQSNDSLNIRLVRQSSGLPDTWLDTKIISTINSDTPALYADTLTNIASVRRIKLYGITGNGFNSSFKLKIIASKK
ncbi:MAG: hypothetical protein SCALA702_25700 [Melioribacteraceae bacterium]|nr:MAG: hypothetical protein SCALA702_25700 [Melioribacteraceae bacterium]